MRILLTGRSGQVGSELQGALAPLGEVSAPGRDDLDLARPDTLRKAVAAARPAVIVNAAAYTAVDAAEKDEARAAAVNAEGPRVLAEEAARCGALLVHYSTDYVFDGAHGAPYREEDPTRPLSAYGRTKLAGEEAIRASGCRHLILRTSWVYAPRGKNFLLTMLRLANERPELRVVADQVGSPTSARAIAEATAGIVRKAMADRGRGGTFHLTCAGLVSWHGFASRIVERGAALGLCRRVPVVPITTSDYPTPATRPAFSGLSNEKLVREFGLRMPPWEDALEACLADLSRARPTPGQPARPPTP